MFYPNHCFLRTVFPTTVLSVITAFCVVLSDQDKSINWPANDVLLSPDVGAPTYRRSLGFQAVVGWVCPLLRADGGTPSTGLELLRSDGDQYLSESEGKLRRAHHLPGLWS